MDAESAESNGEPVPEMCRNAKEFAEKALSSRDEAVKPAGLADEYECTASHMRDMLRELRKEGVVERVGKGLYRSVPGDRRGDAGVAGGGATGSSDGGDARMSEVEPGSEGMESDGGATEQEEKEDAPANVGGSEGNGRSGGGAQSRGTATGRMSQGGEGVEMGASELHDDGSGDDNTGGQGPGGQGRNSEAEKGEQSSGREDGDQGKNSQQRSGGSEDSAGDSLPMKRSREWFGGETDVDGASNENSHTNAEDDLGDELEEGLGEIGEEVSEPTGLTPKQALGLALVILVGYGGWKYVTRTGIFAPSSGRNNGGKQSSTDDTVPLIE